MRYQGQSYELTIPFSEKYVNHFHAAHEKLYGYHLINAPVEIVNVRVRAVGSVSPPDFPALPLAGSDSSHAIMGTFGVYLTDEMTAVPFYNADLLLPGNRISGPAILLRSDTTILLKPESNAYMDEYLNLVISIHL
jgi:N-methylhydantoinase A